MKKIPLVSHFNLTSCAWTSRTIVFFTSLTTDAQSCLQKTGFKLIRYCYGLPIIMNTSFESSVCMNERVNRYKYSKRRKMKENLKRYSYTSEHALERDVNSRVGSCFFFHWRQKKIRFHFFLGGNTQTSFLSDILLSLSTHIISGQLTRWLAEAFTVSECLYRSLTWIKLFIRKMTFVYDVKLTWADF